MVVALIEAGLVDGVEDGLRVLLPQTCARELPESVPVSRGLHTGYQLLALGFDNATEFVTKRLAPDSSVQKNLTELFTAVVSGPQIL